MSTFYRIVLLCAILISTVDCTDNLCEEDSCDCDEFSRLLCKCSGPNQELIIQAEGLIDSVSEIQISNCRSVHFGADSIKKLQELKVIRLSNIGDLVLVENSWLWAAYPSGEEYAYTGVKIHMKNTTIKEIPSYSIKGKIDDIIIHSSNIQSIKAFSFSNLKFLKRIEFVDTTLKNMESQAFKKFSLESLTWQNVIVDVLPSRAFSDLLIRKFVKLHNVTVDMIKSSAFMISGPRKFNVQHCTIKNLLGDAFRVETEGPVKFSHNNITSMSKGALVGFTTSPNIVRITGLQEFNFENNSVTDFEINSLLTDRNSFEVFVKNLMVNKACDCTETNWPSYFWAFENSLMCINEENSYENSENYRLTKCTISHTNVTMVVSLTASILFFILALIIFTVWLAKRRKWSYVAWFTRNFPNKGSGVVMPDGRTYKETELHVIVERAEMLSTDL